MRKILSCICFVLCILMMCACNQPTVVPPSELTEEATHAYSAYSTPPIGIQAPTPTPTLYNTPTNTVASPTSVSEAEGNHNVLVLQNQADMYEWCARKIRADEVKDYTYRTQYSAIHICREVLVIPDGAFSNMTSVKEVEITYGVATIEAGAFSSCSSIKEIIIPDSVTDIGAMVFTGCTSLEAVKLSQYTKKLVSTFSFCTSLKEITIPEGVKSVFHPFEGAAVEKIIFEGRFEKVSGFDTAYMPNVSTLVFLEGPPIENVYVNREDCGFVCGIPLDVYISSQFKTEWQTYDGIDWPEGCTFTYIDSLEEVPEI